jgi:hypothetical protein
MRTRYEESREDLEKHLPASRYCGHLDLGRFIGAFSHFLFIASELDSQQVL